MPSAELHQAGKNLEIYRTKCTRAKFNVSFHFGNSMFYFIALQDQTSSTVLLDRNINNTTRRDTEGLWNPERRLF
jgi:hypothetical protein